MTTAQGQPAKPAQRGRPGLTGRLMAAVRPEFRLDTLIIDPADPVLGGRSCNVSGCERAARLHGLCDGHYQRWDRHGRPGMAEFSAATSAAMRASAPLQPCLIPGCGNGRNSNGLCVGHIRAWHRAGQPPARAWAAAQPPLSVKAPHGTCRVPSCALWATAKTALCVSHAARWRKRGRPDMAEFAAADGEHPLTRDYITVGPLEPHLRLEVQYVLQQRHDERLAPIQPALVRRAVQALARSAITSLLDLPEERWEEQIPAGPLADRAIRPFLRYARAKVEHMRHGSGWDVEYPRQVWRLRNLGIQGPVSTADFSGIRQPWLHDLAKRWTRWRLGSGVSAGHAITGVRAITRLSSFLATAGIEHITQLDRMALEGYLAELAPLGGSEHHGRLISLLSTFLNDIRRHQWDASLPVGAVIFKQDYPRAPRRLPRALAGHVMAQVENPGNLDRWRNPAYRVLTLLLIRCGLRITDAARLAFNCIVQDQEGAPYLRYYNHKMKREALVPIDEQLHAEIGRQQQRVQDRYPGAPPAVLFPRPLKNAAGNMPLSGSTYRQALRPWLERCDIRDQHGQPVHLTPHQWRHTLGTGLINQDVPQHVVQKILDHDSAEMTAHYARLSDKTIREHWEKARKVNASGQPVQLSPDGRLGDAAWTGHQISRATQALPNGYCQLPLVKTCPHANSCLTCPMFATTAGFLPQHHAQRQATLQIITAAEANGHARVAEMNRQVASNLDKIITALEADGKEAAADAS